LSLLGVLGVGAILAFVPFAWPWRCALAWAWLASLLPPLVPWVPWTIRFKIGKPIAPEALFADESDGALRAALARVEAEIATLIDR
jgi:hypothetical protein